MSAEYPSLQETHLFISISASLFLSVTVFLCFTLSQSPSLMPHLYIISESTIILVIINILVFVGLPHPHVLVLKRSL